MWICAVQWVTCGANAPDRIAGALQMNTQPCLNGTGNNLVHRGFDRAFGRGARRVLQTRPSAKYIYIGIFIWRGIGTYRYEFHSIVAACSDPRRRRQS